MKVSKVRDAEEFRQFLIKKITAFKRCRSKLIKKFHEYFFKELKGEELEKAIQDCFIIMDNKELKSDSEMISFLEKEQTIRDPLGTL